jgi:hypothetical protein
VSHATPDVITAQHGFAALVHFLNAFWERDGQPDDSLMKLLSWVSPGPWADGSPADPAMLNDWLEAIEATRAPA